MKLLNIFTIFSIIIFIALPNLDLQVSSIFFDSELKNFPWRETLPTFLIYKSVKVVSILSVGSFLFFAGLVIWRKFLPNFLPKLLKFFDKIKTPKPNFIALVLISIILTPGILVHWVMKPIFERPRPVNIIEFGGTNNYEKPFHLANHSPDEEHNSFPSGHSSMAFIMVVFAFFARNKKEFKTIFTIAFLYGILCASCRVWQGGHFLSDVTISMSLSLYTIFILARILKIKEPE
jgi:lipid A 4'-phosphatase